ncbi:MAG: peptidoglycan recognition family protein, partial [Chloroflexota bacterium]
AYTVNPSTIGICLVGDFTHSGPPDSQLQATKELCQWLNAMLPNDIGYYAHRQVVQTACPGNTWQSWFPAISGESAPSPTPPSQPSATGHARLGLHARGDGGDFPEADFNEFKAARADAIKVMTIHGERSVARLAAQHPGAPFVIRIYQSWGGRNVTPRQFFDWNAPDLDRTMKAIGPGRQVLVELHNEPNLTHEGLGHSWANGAQFNDWLLEALGYYRQAFPNVDYMFPGLSPGGDAPGIRENDLIFIDRCRVAVAACDALGVHAYWNTLPDTPYPMPAALDVVDWYIAQFPTKPVWVTEASNNKADTPANKGQQYVQFWQELRKRPTVQAVTYFICSASDPNFSEEVWASRGIGAIVGQRIREDLVGRREVTYEYPG